MFQDLLNICMLKYICMLALFIVPLSQKSVYTIINNRID